jgi:hypothetical protein
MGLPPVDPEDDDSYMRRLADLQYLKEWEIGIMAAAISRVFSGK